MVIRGGYSRTYDANYINLNLNIFGGFPYLASITFPSANAFVNVTTTTAPNVSNPNQLTRTVVDGNFRSPSTDQFSFEFQRELASDLVMTVGYIHTRGRGLFQTIDGNPRTECPFGTGAGFCNATGFIPFTSTATPVVLAPRVDPTRGIIRLRGNFAESDYNALQVSLNKRLSRNFSANVNYTFSSFIDTASETFNPSNAEVAVAQDSFNLKGDRARSSFDRPHRLSGNFVYELPFYQSQKGFLGRILGGFQVNSFFTIQSGAPFTVLNGDDPAGALNGIDGLVGNAIRANIVSGVNLSGMTIPEIRAACGTPITTGAPLTINTCPALFGRVQPGQRVGNSGRNILRAQRLRLVDFGIIKNTKLTETVRFQVRADMFNVMNERNFGVPEGRINAPNFLNQWATNGGNRRIILGARLVF